LTRVELGRPLAALLGLPLLAALGGCEGGDASAPPTTSEPAAAAAAAGDAGGAAPDEAEAERLAALGYLEVVETEDPDLPVGVLSADPTRMQPGLTYFTNVVGCSSSLVTAAGEEVRRWSLAPCHQWLNSVLLPDGSVLAVHANPAASEAAAELGDERELVKLDWEGRVAWRRRMPAHHDVELLPDGRIATLLLHFRVIPELDPSVPVRDSSVAVLSGEGEILEQQSISDLWLRTQGIPWRTRRARKAGNLLQLDFLHANSIEWMRQPQLAATSPLYAPSNALVCLRHQDAVIAVDLAAKRIVWWWGQGILSGPHDATLLPDGNILIFDNGLARRWSRAVEVDPRSGEIVWEYRAPKPRDFFSRDRGAAQRLPNGNTLLTDSNAGIAFEVTPAGETVWRFRNPNRRDGKPIVIVRARRLSAFDLANHRFERSD
jgi:hypothetical protein